ncbi:MAG: flagellar basal-body rod protein FlgG [Thermoguttaceae bacterium]|jgi:flagellar basal-body rod protein FlgG
MSIQTLHTAATGMSSMQSKLDVIANNLANMETVGFKSGRANFEDLFYHYDKYPGTQDSASQFTPVGILLGMGSRLSSTQCNFQQGSSKTTGNDLDVAIQGQGFFQVKDPTGTVLYTRAGNFSKNANGQIVMGSANIGRLLEPAITIPVDATKVVISSAGVVSVQQPNSQQLQQIGQIELANFINPEGLLKLGENLYSQSDASGNPTLANPGLQGLGTLNQGTLEQSNVDPVNELIDLIATQRAFELNSQAVKAGDQMLQDVTGLIR